MGRVRGRSSGCGTFLLVLFAVFLACKLAGVVEWSWWWVTSPLWLPPAAVMTGLLLLTIMGVGTYKAVSRSARAWMGRAGARPGSPPSEPQQTAASDSNVEGGVIVDAVGTEVTVRADPYQLDSGSAPDPSPSGSGSPLPENRSSKAE